MRGFLNYIGQTYKIMQTYMTGMHLMIDLWRPGRESDGWLSSVKAIEELKLGGDWICYRPHERGPQKVQAAPRLVDNVEVLMEFFEMEIPPPYFVRGKKTGKVYYGFGNALGSGFGNSFLILGEVQYEYGQWSSEEVESGSSNWKEAENLYQAIKNLAIRGLLTDSELFMFTNNLMTENCFTKGSSWSKKLFEIVLAMRKLEFEYGFVVHVVHMSRKRMIQQGTDGISCGDETRGVLAGNEWFTYVPLVQHAFERDALLRDLVHNVTDRLNFVKLTPEGWFDEGHGFGRYIWVPPPAALPAMIE